MEIWINTPIYAYFLINMFLLGMEYENNRWLGENDQVGFVWLAIVALFGVPIEIINWLHRKRKWIFRLWYYHQMHIFVMCIFSPNKIKKIPQQRIDEMPIVLRAHKKGTLSYWMSKKSIQLVTKIRSKP